MLRKGMAIFMKLKEDKINFIKSYSLNQFRSRGFSKVTMDEIARGTGTGKGTLYRYFPTKEDLLIVSLKEFIEQIERTMKVNRESDLNPMDKLLEFIMLISQELSRVNIANLIDIERNVPKAFQMINEARIRVVMENLYFIIEEGKNKNFYQNELDTKLLAHMLIGSAEYLTKPDCLHSLAYDNMNHLFKAIINTLLQGCLTQEGRKYLKNHNN